MIEATRIGPGAVAHEARAGADETWGKAHEAWGNACETWGNALEAWSGWMRRGERTRKWRWGVRLGATGSGPAR